jgi:hypothetical protein
MDLAHDTSMVTPTKAQPPAAQPDTITAASTIQPANTDTTAGKTDSTHITSAVRDTVIGEGQPAVSDTQ